MKKTTLFATAIALFGLAGCGNPDASTMEGADEVDDKTTEEDNSATIEPENDAPESYEKGGLKIYPMKAKSPAYENAKLVMKSPEENTTKDGGMLDFDFAVENYELGKATEGAGENGLANSAKGQHIHLIIDNDPYSAHYEGKFQKEMGASGYHYGIAFLSRSYHESVKNENAYKVFQYYNGKEGEAGGQMNDLKEPMLFYSRPKGEYAGEDAKKILFDFYVVNGELQPDGYAVKTTINEDLEFVFDTWQPYIIEGLPMGENTISIQLVNAQGNAVPSSETVTRTFTLKK